MVKLSLILFKKSSDIAFYLEHALINLSPLQGENWERIVEFKLSDELKFLNSKKVIYLTY